MPKPLTEVIVKLPDQTQHRHVLEPGEYLVGRHPDCLIRVDSPDVSQQHARLFIGVDDLRVEDLGSSNGSFIEGERLTGSIRLRPPQRIQVGSAVLEIKRLEEGVKPVEPPPPSEPTGLTRGGEKYSVGSLIAQGGMGAILDAQDLKIQRKVAMKRLRSGKEASRESLLRFLQEARVLGRLEHPNIVPMYDLDADEQGEVFYTMKLVKGMTLHQALTRIKAGDDEAIAKYALSQLLAIFQKVCDAVSFAHSKGIIHRDLKPENIMLGDFGEVLVMDWGLAKILRTDQPAPEVIEGFQEAELPGSSASYQTMEGRVMGTPDFMPPEQAEGRVKDIDARSDVFSLGGILYNLLTLRAPAEGATASEVMEKIKRGYIAPPVYYNQAEALEPEGGKVKKPVVLAHCPGGKIPEALSAVAMKALAHEPTRRYQSVAELQKDVAAYQGGFATSAEGAGAFRQLGLFLKRHKTVSVAAAVIVVLVGGFTFKLALTLRDLRKSAPAFYAEARSFIEEKDFTNALGKIGTAIALRPDLAEYRLVQGNIYQSLFQFKNAASAYEKVLQRDPKQPLAVENLALSKKLAAVSWGVPKERWAGLAELWQAMIRQDRPAEAQALGPQIGHGIDQREYLDRWRAHLEKGGIKGDLTLDAEGQLRLDLTGSPVTDLRPLQGMFLSSLFLQNTRVSDLSALAGMPLHQLNLNGTAITNLTPLKGMPLTHLEINDTKVADLRPLRSIRLTFLSMSDTPVADLTPLQGAPLIDLVASGTKITDLTALKGMPLEKLKADSTAVRDLSPLRGMQLRHIDLGGTAVRDLSPLRGMRLRFVDLSSGGPTDRVTDLTPLAGMPITTLVLVYQTGITDFGPIKDMPLTGFIAGWGAKFGDADMRLLEGKRLERLELQTTQVSDISVLKGMPLRVLDLGRTRVTDLSVVREMPLERVYLFGTLVTDFTPLRGKHLTELDVSNTSFNDMSVLKGMRLEALSLELCPISDLNYLAGMPIRRLVITGTHVTDLNALRGTPLEILYACGAPITNVSALQGRPLVLLDLHKSHVADIRPLRGMPLRELRLDGCEQLRDLSPLAECLALERLSLPTVHDGIEFLRRLPRLERLSYVPRGDGFDNATTPAEFWRAYDAREK